MSEDISSLAPENHVKIPHYYGDTVRNLFVASVVVSLVAMPLWGNVFPFGTLIQIAGAICFVILAGLTNPHSRTLIMLDTAAAAVGVLLFEYTAIKFYSIDSVFLFWTREVGAILLLFALYASVRTLRSMLVGNIGLAARPWEFEDAGPGDTQSPT